MTSNVKISELELLDLRIFAARVKRALEAWGCDNQPEAETRALVEIAGAFDDLPAAQ